MEITNKNFTAGFHILRVGLAVTFIWIGVLILKSPESWGGYIQPWVANLLPFSISQAMISTAILDIAIGVLLLIDFWTFFAAILAALHLIIVLAVSGISDITIRDIGLLAAAVSIIIDSIPRAIINKILLNKIKKNNEVD